MKKLVIMRGLPGSGKSTMAQGLGGVVFSTDDFFVGPDGYTFDPTMLKKAHTWNQWRAAQAMQLGESLVIIDNTNTQAWEPRPYVQVARELGYEVVFAEPTTSWAFDVEECARRNSHGVPLATIQDMAKRYEPHLTVESVLLALAPWERSAS